MNSLLNANKAILSQKRSLLRSLLVKNEQELTKATEMFTRPCPIVQASVGQHYRHSMDHLELAALLAFSAVQNNVPHNLDESLPGMPKQHVTTLHSKEEEDVYVGPFQKDTPNLHYDLRVRGGTLEKDLMEATKRIESVYQILEEVQGSTSSSNESSLLHLDSHPVNASFMLSSDGQEVVLKSTVGRELLGFAAHHAIHHLAMVKVIALQTLGFEACDLPSDFGMAPSTTHFDLTN